MMKEVPADDPAPAKKVSPLWSARRLDDGAVEDGVWVPIEDGVRIRIRSDRSKTVRRTRNEITARNARLLQAQKFVYTPEQEDEVNTELVARAIVVDWEGVTDEEGTLIAPTRKNIEYICRLLPSVRDDLLRASASDETFRKASIELLAGN